jgi:hypothetical protein
MKVIRPATAGDGHHFEEPTYKCIAFIGWDAKWRRIQADLDFVPLTVFRRYGIIVENMFDMDRTRGYAPNALAYVDMDLTTIMQLHMDGRGHERITMEEAKQWFQAKMP